MRMKGSNLIREQNYGTEEDRHYYLPIIQRDKKKKKSKDEDTD
jgi:hypothetical protein